MLRISGSRSSASRTTIRSLERARVRLRQDICVVIRRLHKADEARVLQKLASGAAVDVRVLRNVLRRRAIYESDSIQHLEKRFDLYRLVAQRGFLIFRGGLRHQAHYPPKYLFLVQGLEFWCLQSGRSSIGMTGINRKINWSLSPVGSTASLHVLAREVRFLRARAEMRFVGHRPGTEVHWQANRHLWFQADYGIFYAGKFVKESQPGHNLTYWALWTGYKF